MAVWWQPIDEGIDRRSPNLPGAAAGERRRVSFLINTLDTERPCFPLLISTTGSEMLQLCLVTGASLGWFISPLLKHGGIASCIRPELAVSLANPTQ